MKIWRLFHIRDIDSKLISVCLIKYYSLIADLHIFIYERANAQNAQPFHSNVQSETSYIILSKCNQILVKYDIQTT